MLMVTKCIWSCGEHNEVTDGAYNGETKGVMIVALIVLRMNVKINETLCELLDAIKKMMIRNQWTS